MAGPVIAGIEMPSFTKDDWQWVEPKYNEDGSPVPGSYGWQMSPSGAQKVAQISSLNPNNFRFNFGTENEYKGGGGGVHTWNYDEEIFGGEGQKQFNRQRFEQDLEKARSVNPVDSIQNIGIKTGDKNITLTQYQNGQPVQVGDAHWDTNPAKRNMRLVKAVGVLAAIATAGAALAATSAAGGAAGAATGAAGAGGADLASAYGVGALGGEAGAITAPASAWGATGAGYIPGTAAASGFTPGAGIVAGEMSGAMAAPAVGAAGASPGIMQRALDFSNNPLVRAGSNIAQNVLGGGQAPVAGEEAAGGVAPTQGVAPESSWSKQNLAGLNFEKIGTGSGGRKPGAVEVPELPQAPGIAGSTLNYRG